MPRFNAVVFDWAGTVIDFGSFALEPLLVALETLGLVFALQLHRFVRTYQR